MLSKITDLLHVKFKESTKEENLFYKPHSVWEEKLKSFFAQNSDLKKAFKNNKDSFSDKIIQHGYKFIELGEVVQTQQELLKAIAHNDIQEAKNLIENITKKHPLFVLTEISDPIGGRGIRSILSDALKTNPEIVQALIAAIPADAPPERVVELLFYHDGIDKGYSARQTPLNQALNKNQTELVKTIMSALPPNPEPLIVKEIIASLSPTIKTAITQNDNKLVEYLCNNIPQEYRLQLLKGDVLKDKILSRHGNLDMVKTMCQTLKKEEQLLFLNEALLHATGFIQLRHKVTPEILSKQAYLVNNLVEQINNLKLEQAIPPAEGNQSHISAPKKTNIEKSLKRGVLLSKRVEEYVKNQEAKGAYGDLSKLEEGNLISIIGKELNTPLDKSEEKFIIKKMQEELEKLEQKKIHKLEKAISDVARRFLHPQYVNFSYELDDSPDPYEIPNTYVNGKIQIIEPTVIALTMANEIKKILDEDEDTQRIINADDRNNYLVADLTLSCLKYIEKPSTGINHIIEVIKQYLGYSTEKTHALAADIAR